MTWESKFDANALKSENQSGESSAVDIRIAQEELNAAEAVFSWNKRLFTLFGVNPLRFNVLLYALISSYSVAHFALSVADLPNSLRDLNSLIDGITEVGSMITVLIKFTLYRVNQRSLAEILMAIQLDYSIERYRNEAEIRILVDYVTKAKTFFKAVIPMSFGSAILYYFRPFTNAGFGVPAKVDSANVTTFVLPYRMIFYYPLTDFTSYIGALVYLLPVIPITAFTLVADASLMLALLAHVCGQLSIMSRTALVHFGADAGRFRRDVGRAIVQHNRLIWMAKKIDSTFNLLMLQQILSVTFFLCFVGYSILLNWSHRDNAQMFTFFLCAAGTLFLLFAYCYAGQCLVDESSYLSDALYASPWYNLSPLDLKYYLMMMNRARFPLVVSGGGFYVYSLSSFLVVLKSTMAYMSVLRTLL